MEYKCATCVYYKERHSAAGYTGPICERLGDRRGATNPGQVYLLCPGPDSHMRVDPNFLCKLWEPIIC